MRHLGKLLAAASALAIISGGLAVSAQSYTDDCSTVNANEVRIYSSFQPVSQFPDVIAWPGYPDQQALKVSGKQAYAKYQISGVDTMQIGICVNGGTTAYAAAANTFYLGQQGSASANTYRCRYDPSSDNVFFNSSSNETYKLINSRDGFDFIKTTDTYQSDYYYGLNVLVSKDGNTFTPVQTVDFVSARSQYHEIGGGVYFYEKYQASIPAGTTHIKLLLMGYSAVPGVSAPSVPRSDNLLFLSNAAFHGNHLTYGTQPASSSAASQESSASSENSSSANSGSSQNSTTYQPSNHTNRDSDDSDTSSYIIKYSQSQSPGSPPTIAPAGHTGNYQANIQLPNDQHIADWTQQPALTSEALAQAENDMGYFPNTMLPAKMDSDENKPKMNTALWGIVGVTTLVGILVFLVRKTQN